MTAIRDIDQTDCDTCALKLICANVFTVTYALKYVCAKFYRFTVFWCQRKGLITKNIHIKKSKQWSSSYMSVKVDKTPRSRSQGLYKYLKPAEGSCQWNNPLNIRPRLISLSFKLV